MNKWLLIGIVIFIVCLISISVYVINASVDYGNIVNDRYYEVGRTKTPLIEITDAKHYYGTEHLIILYGKDEYEEDMVVWMSEDLSFLRHAWLNQGFREELIEEKVKERYGSLKKVHVTPGVENDLFLWEAVYRTETGEFLYAYYDFFTGELLRSIKMRNH